MPYLIFFFYFAIFIPFAAYLGVRATSFVPVSVTEKRAGLQFGINIGMFCLGIIAALLVSIPVAIAARIGWGGQTLLLIGLESSVALILTNILIGVKSLRVGNFHKYSKWQFFQLIGIGYLAVVIFTLWLFNKR